MKKNNSARWVIGLHSVKEAILCNPDWVLEVNFVEGRESDLGEALKVCQKNNIPLKAKSKKFFATLPDGHQGFAASLSSRLRWDDSLAEKEESLVVFLDGITDPHNLGAILRTSWLLGIDGIFIPKNRSVDLTPVVCKVASGGAEHVSVESCHFQSQLAWFKEKGYWVYGLGEKGTALLPQQKPAGKIVLIVGAEDKGLRSSTENFCDQLVRIPQVASGSSYNASVAFGICAYEYSRLKQF